MCCVIIGDKTMNFRLWRFESRRKHLTPRRAVAAAADAFVHHVHCALRALSARSAAPGASVQNFTHNAHIY